MTKLSEILSSVEAGGTCADFLFGVEADVESFEPPPGLKEIAFLWKAEGEDIAMALMDAVIAYRLSGVEVGIEIPAEAESIDAEYLLSVAANANFSVSLLPPASPVSAESASAYEERIAAFTRAYFAQNNLSCFVYPVSSFFEYLVLQTVTDVEGYKPKDPYIIERFASCDPTLEAAIKNRMKAEIDGIFGSDGEFRDFVKGLVLGIYRQTEANAKDLVAAAQAKQVNAVGDGETGGGGGGGSGGDALDDAGTGGAAARAAGGDFEAAKPGADGAGGGSGCAGEGSCGCGADA